LPRTRSRQLRQHLSTNGLVIWHVPLSAARTRSLRHQPTDPQKLSRPIATPVSPQSTASTDSSTGFCNKFSSSPRILSYLSNPLSCFRLLHSLFSPVQIFFSTLHHAHYGLTQTDAPVTLPPWEVGNTRTPSNRNPHSSVTAVLHSSNS